MDLNSTIRHQWIDAGKAFGIFLVVVGHNPYLMNQQKTIFDIVYSFHVPLFFALSGAALKSQSSFTEIFQRSCSLIWVYVAVGLIAIPLVLLKHNVPHAGVLPVIQGLLYGTGHTMHPVPLWFLPCLALSIPIAWAILKGLALLRQDSWSPETLAAAVGLSLCLANAYYLASNPRELIYMFAWGNVFQSGAFWSADLAPLGAGFILIGWSLAGWLLHEKLPKLSIIVAVLLFSSLVIGFSPKTNLDERMFNTPLGSILTATAGICLSFLMLHRIKKCPVWVVRIGAATLPILAIHQFAAKSLLTLMGGSAGNVNLLEFIASCAFAIGLSTFLDHFLFRNTIGGRLIFYPRTILKRSGTSPVA